MSSIALVYVNKEVNFPQKCATLAVFGSSVYALWLTCSQRLLDQLTFESFDYECTWCVSIDITFVVFIITEHPDQKIFLKWIAEISQWTTPLPTIPRLTQIIFVCPPFSNLFIVIWYWQKEVVIMYKGFLARWCS